MTRCVIFAFALLASSAASAYDPPPVVHPKLTSDSPNEFVDVEMWTGEDPATIPGSDDYYKPVLLRDEVTRSCFDVYTNGVLLRSEYWNLSYTTNGGRFVSAGNQDDYLRYGVNFDIAGDMRNLHLPAYDPDRDPTVYAWRPGIFDFAFRLGDDTLIRYVRNGKGEIYYTSLGRFTGRGELYQPCAFRLDGSTYAALTTTYSAYYERLCYASEGQDSSWAELDGPWGPLPDASQNFLFNLTNDEYAAYCYFDIPMLADGGRRTILRSQKLTEWDRLRRLRENLRDEIFGSEVVISPSADAKLAVPSFVYRPGWILDPTGPDSNHVSRVWWSSTAPVPLVDIPAVGQLPSEGPTEFIPVLRGWTEGAMSAGTNWPMFCVTWNMAFLGNDASHPLAELMRIADYDGPEDLDEMYHFNFMEHGNTGVCKWLTNSYPRCVQQYYDPYLAMRQYMDSAWGPNPKVPSEGPSRRLSPNDYVGINQLLGAMDRTYHIPSMTISSSNETQEITTEAEWRSDRDPIKFKVKVTQNPYGDPTVEITKDKSGMAEVTKVSGPTFEYRTIASNVYDGVVYAEVNVPSYRVSSDGGGVTFGPYDVWLDEKFLADHGVEGKNTMDIIALSGGTGRLLSNAIGVQFSDNGTEGTGVLGASAYDEEREASFNPELTVRGEYELNRPVDTDCKLGATQPGPFGIDSGRVKDCQYGGFFRVQQETNSTDNGWIRMPSVFRFLGPHGYEDHDALLGSLKNQDLFTCREDVLDRIAAVTGSDPRDPGSFAFPGSADNIVRYTLSAEYTGYIAHAYEPLPEVFTNNVYEYWFNSTSNIYPSATAVEKRRNYDNTDFYEVRTTLYSASGLVVTNDVKYVNFTVELTNVQYEDYPLPAPPEEEITFEFKAGPFDGPRDYCAVERYIVYQDVVESNGVDVIDWYRETTNLVVVMTGTGPGSPGEEDFRYIDTVYDFIRREEPWYEIGSGTNYTVDTSTDILPTSEATSHTGGETYEATKTQRIYFDKENELVSNVRSVEWWINPITGEYEEEPDIFPIPAGYVEIRAYITPTYSLNRKPGPLQPCACRTTENFRIITQTDWSWHEVTRREPTE